MFTVTTAALVALGFDLLPLASLRDQANAAAADGAVDRFAAMMDRLRLRAKALSALFAVLTLASLVLRARIEGWLSAVRASMRPAKETLRRAFRSFTEDRIYLVALLALIVVAVWIRAEYLTLPVRTDEAQTFVDRAFKPFYVGLSYYDHPNNHLLNTLLTRIAYLLTGDSLWALRLPSLVAGVLTIPASYVLFAMHYDRNVGLLTAGLTAFSFPLLLYSVQSRGYSFLVLFFLLALIVCAWLERQDLHVLWLAFAAIGAVGAYAMPLMLYPYAICLGWFVGEKLLTGQSLRWSRIGVGIASTGLLTLFLYLPVFLVSGPMAVIANESVDTVGLEQVTHGVANLPVSLWSWFHTDLPPWAAVAMSVLAVVGLVAHRRISDDAVPIAAAGIVFLLPLVYLQHVIPPRRAFVFLAPVYLGLVGAGVVLAVQGVASEERSRLIGPLAALGVGLAGSLNARAADTLERNLQYGGMTRPQEVVDSLRERVEPQDDVVGRYRLLWPTQYYLASASMDRNLAHGEPDGPRLFVLFQTSEDREDIEDVAAKYDDYGSPERLTRIGNVVLYRLTRVTP